jgi:hypothetical protein
MNRLPLLLMLCALAPLPARAELYRWTDASGQVHFSDKKPGGGNNVRTLQAPEPTPLSGGSHEGAAAAGTSDDNITERQKRMADLLRQEDAEREAAARDASARKAQQQHDCNRLRDYQRSLEGRPVYQLDDKGQRHFIDDKSRDEYTQRLNQYLSEHCK